MNIPESIKEEIRNKGYSIKERYFVLKRKAPLDNPFSLREDQVEWIAGDEDRDSFLPMTSDDALSEAKKAYDLAPNDRSKHSDSDFFGDEGVEDGNGDFIFIFRAAGSDYDLNALPYYRGISGIFELLPYDDAPYMFLSNGKVIRLVDAINEHEAACMAYAYFLTIGDNSLSYKVEFREDNPKQNILTGELSFESDLSDNEWISVEWDSVDKVFIGSNNEKKNIH